ncbi:MAG: hypothetical protein ABSF83_11900 [Nitrososphaerales archaeon]|jgi:hypothetical protein
MSDQIDGGLCALVNNLIPISRRRVLQALERSREAVEIELATLSNLLTIKERMGCSD